MHTHDMTAFEHPHLFHFSGTQAERRTLRVVLLTVAMMVVEIAAGWAYNSMALLADGWHMSTHAAALGIAWLAFVLARRHAADRRFAFGTWKIEILGGFVSAILLGLVGVAMVLLSVERLRHPAVIRFNEALVVAVVGLVVNLVSVLLLADRPHEHEAGHPAGAHAHGSLNLRAAYVHVLADALTSVLAIAALVGGKFWHWNWLDPATGIVGAVLILRWTVLLLRDTGSILLDRETDDAMATAIRQALEADGDTRLSDLHVWKVGQGKYACIVAVVADHFHPPEEYKTRLQFLEDLVHVTVETNPCPDPADGKGFPIRFV